VIKRSGAYGLDDAQMLYRRTGFVNHDLAMEKALVGVDSAVKA
jgi:hypothetical protein